MGEIPGLLLEFLRQFAGGPGAPENNLVRFGLSAVFWGVLLFVAWSRQRHEDRPREKLLVWGFGLALLRELVMLVATANHILNPSTHNELCNVLEPIEHALGLASIVMIAGSFLRYILDDAPLARRYLQIGLGTAAVGFFITSLWWHSQVNAEPGIRFHSSWPAWLMHLLACIFVAAAMAILIRNRGWLRNIVLVAFSFLFLSEFLLLLNYVNNWQYAYVLCPIANSFHIWAAPLFGYVYFREQSIEKKQAEEALGAYRHHLEELVTERTAELTDANKQLQREIKERRQAQAETSQRNTELAAQNAIAATLSMSLNLDAILRAVLDTAIEVLEMESGCIYLLDPNDGNLAPTVAQQRIASGAWMQNGWQQGVCKNMANETVANVAPILVNVLESPDRHLSDPRSEDGHQLLVGIPMISRGRALGAMMLAVQQENEVVPQRIEVLTAIGQHIGMAVQNARLYRETQRWAGGMTLLLEASESLSSAVDPREIYDQIAQRSAKLVASPAAHLFLWEKGHQEAVHASSHGVGSRDAAGLRLQVDESPILPEILDQGQPITIVGAAEDPRIPTSWHDKFEPQSLLCMPLWGSAGEALGFLLMVDPYKARRWRSLDIDLLKNFLSRAAIALENVQLYEQLEWAAALEERQRLAAEMHDGLAQTLSYLGLRTDRVAELAEEGQTQLVEAELQQMRHALGRATREVRSSIASLQEGPHPQRSLQATLSQIIDQFAQDHGTPVKVQNRVETPIFLPAENLDQVSRVVQEALLNAHRHAQAHQITLSLDRAAESLEVVVADDGQGFSLEGAETGGDNHFGLSIMRARAARIEGELQIESQPGRGTRVRLAWPLDATVQSPQGWHSEDSPDQSPADPAVAPARG